MRCEFCLVLLYVIVKKFNVDAHAMRILPSSLYVIVNKLEQVWIHDSSKMHRHHHHINKAHEWIIDGPFSMDPFILIGNMIRIPSFQKKCDSNPQSQGYSSEHFPLSHGLLLFDGPFSMH